MVNKSFEQENWGRACYIDFLLFFVRGLRKEDQPRNKKTRKKDKNREMRNEMWCAGTANATGAVERPDGDAHEARKGRR